MQLQLHSPIFLYDMHRDNFTFSHLMMMPCTGCSKIKHRIQMMEVVFEGRVMPLILALPLIFNMLHYLDGNM